MPANYGDALSKRELEITTLVSEGLSNKEIATRLYLSPNTIKVHLRNVFTKTGVASRTELSMLAVQEGWVQLPRTENNIPLPASETPPAEPAPVTPEPEVPAPEEIAPTPSLSRTHQVMLLAAFLLSLVALFLPRNPGGQTATPSNAGLYDQQSSSEANLEPLSSERWQELPSMPVRRARMAVSASQEKLYVIGGMTKEGTTGRLDIYHIDSQDWTSGAPRPVALANVTAATLEDQILVPGGCDANGQPRTDTHLYDINNDTWHEVAPLPTALCGYALTTYQGQAYLFGGWDGQAYRANAYRYTPQDDTWENLSAPSLARGFGAAATLVDSQNIFYVGGYDGKREWDTCEVYLPQTDHWEMCAPMLLPRGGLGLVAMGNRLQAIGGGWTTYLGFNERYDPASDTWVVMDSAMQISGEWRNLGLTTWDTSVYAVGGWSGDYLNRTYALEILQFRVFIPSSSTSGP